jgi:hypothetical protein
MAAHPAAAVIAQAKAVPTKALEITVGAGEVLMSPAAPAQPSATNAM